MSKSLKRWLTMENCKRLFTMVIVLCFFLPLSQCSYQPKVPVPSTGTLPAAMSASAVSSSDANTDPRSATVANAGTASVAAPSRDYIPLGNINLRQFESAMAVLIALFLWPPLAWWLRRGWRSRRGVLIMNVIECVASAGSFAYFFLIIMLVGQIRYGGVMILAAYGGYFLTCGGYLIKQLWKKMG